MGKVLRKEVPKSVRIAQFSGDTETLRHLGRIGATKKARQKRGSVIKKEIKMAAAEVMDFSYLDEILAAEYARRSFADAYAHAMSNRIGWDDSLS